MSRVLLLSGGLDSTSIAAWQRPEHCLTINYGQKAAAAEQRAASAITEHLRLPATHLTVNAAAVGGGLMSTHHTDTQHHAAEWWPYRNQLLVTIAAAWAVTRDYTEVLIGTVSGDGDRHADGTTGFYDALNNLLALQEGSLRVAAPAIHLAAAELIAISGVDDTTLGWTHSCHVSDIPCGHCPGCAKRMEVLATAGRT